MVPRHVYLAWFLERVLMTEMRKHDMGAGGRCICPKCDETIPHSDGVRCQDERCQSCGAKMLREGSHHHELLQQKKAKKESGTNQS